MMPAETPRPAASALDTAIKVLTILKLLAQLAFYGILLGGLIWARHHSIQTWLRSIRSFGCGSK